MAERTLNGIKMIMRHDTTEEWSKNNPILMAGEIGVAIDSD